MSDSYNSSHNRQHGQIFIAFLGLTWKIVASIYVMVSLITKMCTFRKGYKQGISSDHESDHENVTHWSHKC